MKKNYYYYFLNFLWIFKILETCITLVHCLVSKRWGLSLFCDVSWESNFHMGRQGVQLTFFPGSHLAPKYFKVVANSKKLMATTHTHNHFYPATVPDRLNCWKFARATKRSLQRIIYNLKGYLNPRWRIVTIDLRSKSCMCCVLKTSLTRNFAAALSLQIFNNH